MRKIILLVLMSLVLISSVSALSSGYSGFSSVSSYQTTRPGFNTFYSSSDINNYWPILGDKDNCQAREDVMLSVAPAGCQPAVVRSDILADQNVPVFCQIDAYNINPLVDIKEIKNIRFSGTYPKEIAGTGFHPARAAIRTRDQLLGDPLINNIGYAVVILKRNQNESSLPNYVQVNLTAQIDYNSGNSLGIGRAEFMLKQVSDADWESSKNGQSFWNGRYFVRLDGADPNTAMVSIYNGDRKISSVKVDRDKTSNAIYLPGMYCQAGLQVAYDGITAAQKSARIEVTSAKGTDVIDVYPGMNFLDGRCRLASQSSFSSSSDGIQINRDGETGSVTLSCDSKKMTLELKPRFAEFEGQLPKPDGAVIAIDLGARGIIGIDGSNNLVQYKSGKWIAIGTPDASQLALKDALIKYKAITTGKNNTQTSPFASAVDKKYASEFEQNFADAVSAYEKVADDYPAEKKTDAENMNDGYTYAEEALRKAVDMARIYNKAETEVRLMNKFIEKFPNNDWSRTYAERINELYVVDSSLAGQTFDLSSGQVSLRLVKLSQPTKTSTARLTFFYSDSLSRSVQNPKSVDLSLDGKTNDVGLNNIRVILDSVDTNSVKIRVGCDGKDVGSSSATVSLDRETEICGTSNNNRKVSVRLDDVTLEEVAKIRLLPVSKNAATKTNLTVTIGIEKRLIQLNPDQTKNRIANLNKSIEQWEKINKNLGNVVTGLRAACFGTAAGLTIKNFIAGITGEAAARTQVMSGSNGWDSKCKKMFEEGKYTSMDDCYSKNADKINADIKATKDSINEVNKNLKEIQNKHKTSSSTGLGAIFGDKTFDESKAKADLADLLKQKYGTQELDATKNPWGVYGANGTLLSTKKNPQVNEVLTDDNIASMDYLTMRDMYLSLETKDRVSGNPDALQRVNGALTDTVDRTNRVLKEANGIKQSKLLTSKGLPNSVVLSGAGSPKIADISPIGNLASQYQRFQTSENIQYVARIRISENPSKDKSSAKYSPGEYLVGLKKEIDGKYTPVQVVSQEDPLVVYDSTALADFNRDNGISYFISSNDVSYNNKMGDPLVRYYETAPYSGLPAIVPFDKANGWYAATKQTLPAFGSIATYDASGKVSSVWLCNVGENGVIDFDTGMNDDICQQFNLNTGQSYSAFPGLSETEAKKRVSEAIEAISQASEKYATAIKSKQITLNIGGRKEFFRVGSSMANLPGTRCQDYYSVDECKILFNVCDPVICPPSRCDFGGKYPVANVQQTGIVGSTLLCLPNAREGIVVPVCLSGIQAGVDSYVSLMKNHRDCLQENINSGQMVGICDQIYSIYACEFFWKQVAPVANVLIPKLAEVVTGKTGMRGGGEYGTFNSAWQNSQNAIKYFTDTYAINTFKAFQARSMEEAGTPICKAFISAKTPTTFKSLLESESPPQFYATFSSTTFTTATVPATAQYKVFYHIFAGKDAGVSYRVYLRSPPESSYYSSASQVMVASGYVRTGQYASETKDFTAPEGYKELCVDINGEQKCGFKQVSTDFAVNYLRDKYVADQIGQKGITSGGECVSGTPSVESLLANTNPQAAVEETINPQIYSRGITRICATNNPGSSTNPERYVDVGYCDDQKVRCWIDKNSVSNAITAENIGVKNATLKELDAITAANFQRLQAIGEVLTDAEANNEIWNLEGLISNLEKSGNLDEAKIILQRINLVEQKIYLNHHKAKLWVLRGDVYAILAKKSFKDYSNNLIQSGTASGGNTGSSSSSGSSTGSGTGSSQTETTGTTGTTETTSTQQEAPSSKAVDLSSGLSLESNYNSKNQIFITDSVGQRYGMYLFNSQVRYVYLNANNLQADALIGSISSANVITIPSKSSTYPNINKDILNYLSGATVSGNKIVK